MSSDNHVVTTSVVPDGKRLKSLRRRRDYIVLALALTAHILILAILFGPAYPRGGSTLGLYVNRGAHLVQGQMPYRDFPWEYPPLSLVFIGLPALLTTDYQTYRLAFAVEMALCDLALVSLTWAWLRQRGRDPAPALVAQTLFLIGAGEMIVLERYDLLPAAMTFLALYLWPKANERWSWVCVGLGTALKIYPAVLAPLLAVDHLRRRDWAGLVQGALLCGLLVLATFVPFLVLASQGVLDFLAYQGQRGVQIESLWATPLILGHLAGWSVSVSPAFGSFDVITPLSPLLARLALPLAAASVVLVAWRYRRRPASDDRRVRYATTAVLAFMLFNKVLSAQFVLWLYPLLPLAAGRRSAMWEMYFVALCLTQAIYPFGIGQLVGLEPLGVFVQGAQWPAARPVGPAPGRSA